MKLNILVMGGNCQKFVRPCLNSCKGADDIIFVYDTTSKDNTLEELNKWKDNNPELNILRRAYDHESKTGNSDHRNWYLNYLKKNHSNEWVLVLDADEVLDDGAINKLRSDLPALEKGVYQVKMRHLQGDFGNEDATVPTHYVLNRLFHVSDASHYPEGEHPVLQSNEDKYGRYDAITVWHLAYCPGMWYIKERYDNHAAKSEIHSPQFLRTWYFAHLFGKYKKQEINPVDLPTALLDEFGIEKDELYFAGRSIEPKHWHDSLNWKHFFAHPSVLEFGAGLGPRTMTMRELGLNAKGIELSKYAVKHQLPNANVEHGDILTWKGDKADLVLAYDILEHIDIDDLPTAIENIKAHTNEWVLVSVPAEGDPNLYNDPTHKIFKPMGWWKRQFTDNGFEEIEVPNNFLFRHQTFIMRLKNGNA